MIDLLSIGLYDLLPPWAIWTGVAAAFIAARGTEAWAQIRVVYRGEGKSALHDTSGVHEAAYYGLLYLSGLPLAFCLGVQMVAALAFQVPLNLELGNGPFDESGSWTFFGKDIPKPFSGERGRPIQFMLGVFLIILSLIAPYI